MSSEEEFLKKLRAAFVAEAQEQVERISAGLSSLHSSDPQTKTTTIENTFREVHNLKGSARAVNLLSLEAVCQALEDVFALLKRGEREVNHSMVDTLHDVVDAISSFLSLYETNYSEDSDTALLPLLTKLEGLRGSNSDAIALPGHSDLSELHTDSASGSQSNEAAETHLASGPRSGVQADLKLSPALQSNLNFVPQAESTNTHPDAVPQDFTATTDDAKNDSATNLKNQKPVSAKRYANPLLEDFVFPAMTETPVVTENVPRTQDASREIVRIPAGRLDELLMRAEDMLSLKIMSRQQNQDLHNVGFKFDTYNRDWTKIYQDVRAARQLIDKDDAAPEAVMIESVLTRVLEFLEQQQQHLSALSSQLTALRTASVNDYRVTSSTVDTFLENTKRLLMMPAATMLDVMPKLVRDLARELGKEVDLTIFGSTIQLDKRILAQLKDPLIHILRNSIDHGLEKPEARVIAGKPARGTINIAVSAQQGNTVQVTVSDDGAGINTERVKEIGLQQKLITPEQAETMSETEAISLIFQSSFSTSSTISEISGRGLGLAIVKENIANLGGKLIVESERGKGTKFKINVPMTVATFRGVLIKCAGEVLIVPTADMEKVVKIKTDQMRIDSGACKIDYDKTQIPFVSLTSILDLPNHSKRGQQVQAIVLKHDESAYAFEVDEVLEEQEILVKKLSKPIIRVRNVAGVTILGTGKPSVILSVPDLIKSAKKLTGQNIAEVKQNATPVKQKRILVVDDTITARILMKNILESAGYSVKTASDGAEALRLIGRDSFDLLVSDIEMPKMNGIELTSAVRKQNSTLPIILVTSMTDPTYREKGTEAGANAFFVKSSFDKDNLVDVIRRLI